MFPLSKIIIRLLDSVAAREGGLWGSALPEIYKENKENIFF
jgi:hypothetical protein